MTNSKPQALMWRRGQRGITLMELMVAMGMGAFLVLGVVTVFISSKESGQLENALARVQENGRFALDTLSDDIRSAHYTGCNSVKRQVTLIANDINYVGLRGYSRSGGSWSSALDQTDPALRTLDSSSVRDGTDILNLHVAKHVGDDLLVADVIPNSTSINLSDNPGCQIESGDVVVVSNCLTAHVIRVNASPSTCDPATVTPTVLTLSTTGNNAVPIEPGYRYDGRSEIMQFESVVWYVADTGRDRNGVDVYALYRKSLDQTAEEMIEGVEFMSIRYGQRAGSTSNPSTRYVAAGDADLDWDEVVSVRVGLLIQSYDLVRDAPDTTSYVLLDPNNPLDPNEHGGGLTLRRVFKTTTALRNTDFDT